MTSANRSGVALATFPVLPVLLTIVFVGAAYAQQDSWPRFHGPRNDNISDDTGLLTEWPDDGPKMIWTRSDCGCGFSGVSIADGMIFTAGDFGDVEKVTALDMDGNPLWQSPNGKTWPGPYPGSRTTPTFDDGMLYHMNPTGRLAAYRARSGKEVWAVDLGDRFGARYGTWAMAENVIVEGDLVFCIPGGSKALATALNKKSGETVWTCNELDETAAYCSPVIATVNGTRQLLAVSQKSVISLDIQTGKLLWSHPHVAKHDQNITAPLVSGDLVFIASGHSAGGRLLKVNADSSGVEEVWWKEELDNCHGGVILLDGLIYGSACKAGGRGFFCVDFKTGAARYFDKSIEKLSLTAADGKLYGLTQRGEMLLIETDVKAPTIVSRFQVPKKGKDFAFAHPVICGGRLYARYSENLCVYDLTKPTVGQMK